MSSRAALSSIEGSSERWRGGEEEEEEKEGGKKGQIDFDTGERSFFSLGIRFRFFRLFPLLDTKRNSSAITTSALEWNLTAT